MKILLLGDYSNVHATLAAAAPAPWPAPIV